LENYGTLVLDSLESVRNSMRPEYEIIGDENSRRID
ncbi:unnamed protein product, partial [Rhizophagus irregularis]